MYFGRTYFDRLTVAYNIRAHVQQLPLFFFFCVCLAFAVVEPFLFILSCHRHTIAKCENCYCTLNCNRRNILDGRTHQFIVHPPDAAGRVFHDARDVDGAPDVDKHLLLAHDRGGGD
jgi:hypothetical protein